MKIVNRKTFLSLPAETLYSKYAPYVFGELAIKCETVGDDFVTQQIADSVWCNDSDEFFDILDAAARTGESFSMDFDSAGRDGLFDDEQLFVVWEREDVVALIERLTRLVGPNTSNEAR